MGRGGSWGALRSGRRARERSATFALQGGPLISSLSASTGKNHDRREHWSIGERQTVGADRGHSSDECGYPARPVRMHASHVDLRPTQTGNIKGLQISVCNLLYWKEGKKVTIFESSYNRRCSWRYYSPLCLQVAESEGSLLPLTPVLPLLPALLPAQL